MKRNQLLLLDAIVLLPTTCWTSFAMCKVLYCYSGMKDRHTAPVNTQASARACRGSAEAEKNWEDLCAAMATLLVLSAVLQLSRSGWLAAQLNKVPCTSRGTMLCMLLMKLPCM